MAERFFLKLIPSAVKKRDNMLVSAFMPHSSRNRRDKADRVISGSDSNTFKSHSRCGFVFEGR
jgi:hypothetical protein